MAASRRVARAVSAVLNTAPRRGEVSMVRLVQAVAESRDRPIEIQMEELPPGVCGALAAAPAQVPVIPAAHRAHRADLSRLELPGESHCGPPFAA